MADSTPRERPKVAHLRLPPELHAELSAFADRTRRSLNGAAVYLLERGLQAETEPPAPSPDPIHLR